MQSPIYRVAHQTLPVKELIFLCGKIKPLYRDGTRCELCDRRELPCPTEYCYPESMGQGYRHRDEIDLDNLLLTQGLDEEATLEKQGHYFWEERDRAIRKLAIAEE